MSSCEMPAAPLALGRIGDQFNSIGVEGVKAIAAVLKDTQLVQLE